jgi:hypothetical protein
MVHVDDRIEPGAKQVLLARLPPFPWPHLVPRRSRDTTENHESNLQGIPFRMNDFRQIQLPNRVDFRFPIKGLGILHGRLFSKRYRPRSGAHEAWAAKFLERLDKAKAAARSENNSN